MQHKNLDLYSQRKKCKRKSKEKKEKEVVSERAQEIFNKILFSFSLYHNENTFYSFIKRNA